MKKAVMMIVVIILICTVFGCGTKTESETIGKSEFDLEAIDEANIRSAIAVLTAALLMGDVNEEEVKKNDNDNITFGIYEDGSGLFAEVLATQKQDGWQNASSNTGKEIGSVYVFSSTTGWKLTASLTDSDLPIMVTSLD